MAISGSPEQHFVIPDRYLRGKANVVSVTSEAGAFPGGVSPDEANLGNLIPLQSGRLSDLAEAVEYRLQEGGGLGSAEWLYRRLSDTSADFFGADDSRRFWGWHSPQPLIVAPPGSDNCSVAYAKDFRRVVAVGIDSATDLVTVIGHDVDTDRYDEWSTLTTFTLEHTVETGDHSAALIDLPDGRLMLAVRIDQPQAPVTDIDIYHSADGGVTWRLVSQEILKRFNDGSAFNAHDFDSQLRMARAGEHIRLVFIQPAATPITWLSTDRGMTWKKLADASFTVNDTGLADDPLPFDIEGIDEAGTFLFAYADPSNPDVVLHAWASGDGDWTTISTSGVQIPVASEEVVQVNLALTPEFIYELIAYSDRGGGGAELEDGWLIRRVIPRDFLQFAVPTPAWEQSTTPAVFENHNLNPGRLKTTWIGHSMIAYGARQNAVTGVDVPLASVFYLGQWNQRSLGEDGPSILLGNLTDPLATHQWHTALGSPDVASSTSNWVRVQAGTGAEAHSVDRLDLNGSAVADTIFFELTIPAATEGWGFADDTAFVWTMALATGDSTVAADDVAVQIIGGTAATNTDISIRIGPTSVVVFDNNAALTRDTIVLTIDSVLGADSVYHEFRYWKQNQAGLVQNQLAIYNHSTRVWTVGVKHISVVTAAASANILRWGHLGQTQATAMDSRWRDMNILVGPGAANQAGALGGGLVNPDDQFGQIANNGDPFLVEHGLHVIWAGLGGGLEDLFEGGINHVHAAESAFVRSPRVDWRSGGADPQAANTMILDSGDAQTRFRHDVVLLLGTNSRDILVDYDTDPAFGSPTAASTVDATAFETDVTPLEVLTVAGALMRLVTPTLPAVFPFVRGEARDHYARVTAGGGAGLTFKITRHLETDIFMFDDELTNLSAQGVAVGDSLVVFASQAYVEFSVVTQRFMRLRFDDTDTAEGDHRLGAIVAGVKVPIDVPLDFAHTDDEQPNVTNIRTRSAVGWSYREGPEQRVITGRIVGDVSQRFRDELRHMLEHLDFEATPMALILDGERPVETAIYGTIANGSTHDNVSWFIDADGILRRTGDQTVVFTEEV